MNRPPDETELYERFRDFGAREVRPSVREHDDAHRFHRAAFTKLGAADFFRLPVRRELGGHGRGLHAYAAALEGLCDGSGDLGFGVSVLAHMVCPLVLEEFGTPEQQRVLLPRLLSGEWLGGIANAEAQAGTNLLALATSATRVGDDFELTGEKQCITNVGSADVALCSVRLKDVSPRKELNIFLVETARPGVEQRTLTTLEGLRTSCTGDLKLRQTRVPPCMLVGRLGLGLEVFRAMFLHERLFTGVLYLSALRSCTRRAVEHAETRMQFGRPIGRNQHVQEKIIRMRVAGELLAGLLRDLRSAVERGEDVSEQLSMVKVHGIEAALRASADLMRLLGGRGMNKQELAEKYHRDLLALSVLGGTVELHKIVIYTELTKQAKRQSARGGRPAPPGLTVTVHDAHDLDPALEKALVELTARVFPGEESLHGKFYYDTRPDLIVAAWKDGSLVGFRMVVRRLVDLGPGPIRLAGLGIAVDPAHQRQGIGTELTRRTLEVLREHNDELALAFLFSPNAEPLLKTFGFRQLDARVTYLRRGWAELVTETMPAYSLDLGQGTLVEDVNARGTLHLGTGSW